MTMLSSVAVPDQSLRDSERSERGRSQRELVAPSLL
jgi:hypothetical protein